MALKQKKIIFLGSTKGRICLLSFKFIGLIFDFIALDSANVPQEIDIGVGPPVPLPDSGLFATILLIFLFERMFIFGLIWIYGFHPNQEYEAYALKEIEENEAGEKEKQDEATPDTKSPTNAPPPIHDENENENDVNAPPPIHDDNANENDVNAPSPIHDENDNENDVNVKIESHNYNEDKEVKEPQQTENESHNYNEDKEVKEPQQTENIDEFLKYFELSKYIQGLKEFGVETLSDLNDLADNDISELCEKISMPQVDKDKFINAYKQVQDGNYPIKKSNNIAIDEGINIEQAEQPDHEETNGQTDGVMKNENIKPSKTDIMGHIKLMCQVSPNAKLEGIRTLWYGSLWNTSHFIAQIYKYKPWPQAKYVMIAYGLSILFLFIMSCVYINATYTYFGNEQITSFFNNISDGSTDVSLDFTPFDGFMLFISMMGVQIGLIQHGIAIGILYNEKMNGSKQWAKYTGYVIGFIFFIVMIVVVASLIDTLNALSEFGKF